MKRPGTEVPAPEEEESKRELQQPCVALGVAGPAWGAAPRQPPPGQAAGSLQEGKAAWEAIMEEESEAGDRAPC